MNSIIDPNTKKYYSIFGDYGRSLLKKYIKLYQNGGSVEGGAGKDEQPSGSNEIKSCQPNIAERVYPCEIGGGLGEHHNEPIQPLLIQDENNNNNIRVFKIRNAGTEIKLMELFDKINLELDSSNIMNERLGIVDIQQYKLTHNGRIYEGSSWQYINGQKIEEIGFTQNIANNKDINSYLYSNMHLLEAVSKLIGLTDLHNDNLIIHNNTPYCIDGEVFEIHLDDSHNTGLGNINGKKMYSLDIITVHKFMLKLLRNKTIYNLLHKFRQELNNFRVLMGDTGTYSNYAGSYLNHISSTRVSQFNETLNTLDEEWVDDNEDKTIEIINKNNKSILTMFMNTKTMFPLIDWLNTKYDKWNKDKYTYDENIKVYSYAKNALIDREKNKYTKDDLEESKLSLKEILEEYVSNILDGSSQYKDLKSNIERIITRRLTSFKSERNVQHVIDVINRTIAHTSTDKYKSNFPDRYGYVPVYIYKDRQLFIPYSILDGSDGSDGIMIGDVYLGRVKKPDPVFIPDIVLRKLTNPPNYENNSKMGTPRLPTGNTFTESESPLI